MRCGEGPVWKPRSGGELRERVTGEDIRSGEDGENPRAGLAVAPHFAKLRLRSVTFHPQLSKTQWHDEEGYHSASVTMSQIYRPEDR